VLKPRPAGLRALLWAVWNDASTPTVPGSVAQPRDPAVSELAYAAMGYRVLGTQVLRIDRVERLAAAARHLARQGPFGATPALATLAGCPVDMLAAVLPALGYRVVPASDGAPSFHTRKRGRERSRYGKPDAPRHARRRGKDKDAEASPFAKLRELRLVR
jgi:ATP-dependent RNA helicase SUPV3L1/SUV3